MHKPSCCSVCAHLGFDLSPLTGRTVLKRVRGMVLVLVEWWGEKTGTKWLLWLIMRGRWRKGSSVNVVNMDHLRTCTCTSFFMPENSDVCVISEWNSSVFIGLSLLVCCFFLNFIFFIYISDILGLSAFTNEQWICTDCLGLFDQIKVDWYSELCTVHECYDV